MDENENYPSTPIEIVGGRVIPLSPISISSRAFRFRYKYLEDRPDLIPRIENATCFSALIPEVQDWVYWKAETEARRNIQFNPPPE